LFIFRTALQNKSVYATKSVANGKMDWMVWNWDDKLKNYVFELTDPVDTIILGRKMTPGFVSYWSGVMTKPDDPFYAFAKKMIETPMVVD